MNIQERIGGLIWLILGIGICIGSINMKIGEIHRPGPGFTPLLTGVLLGLFGLVLLLSSISKRGDEERQIKNANKGMGKNWKKVLTCVLALFGYTFLLKPLGFFTTTGVFLFALFKMGYPAKWRMPLIIVGSTIVLSYLIFTVWLKIHFPGGVTGF